MNSATSSPISLPLTHSPPHWGKRAFTLIELLTVIAIIGILAGILIPITGRVRDSARTAQCASNMRQLTQSALLYAQDNRNRLPPTYKNPVSSDKAWWQLLYPDYCQASGVYKCPDDQTPFEGSPPYTGIFTRSGRTLPDGKVSYGISGDGEVDPPDPSKGHKAANKTLDSFPTPSRMCFLAEYQHAERRLSQYWHGQMPRYYSEMTFPHNGKRKGNFSFLDGHVILMSAAERDAARTEKRYNFGFEAPW
ncbi:type II secretion system protein [Geminisphaera colitermitum]|uniref:type II secretion system protein n=1 Tax=Geminisphaera colitermitum TaxID=1148786 RepID=UPI000158CC19|nr:prepilin-type N-terminal cleavage/methylation domain-containing protein [Geminisphaera colitermitum]